jgi:hypothetical protein
MNTSLYQTLLSELADIERQQDDKTLSHSDQRLLNQAWEDISDQIEDLERPRTPESDRPVRVAPPPPAKAVGLRSVTHQTGLSRSGRLMTLLPDGRWVPAPPIPYSAAPAAPAAPARVCNCDSDGECSYCEEERWNAMADDREDCAQCSGCHYCAEDQYDGADEV